MIGYRYFRDAGVWWRYHHGALIPLQMPHAAPLETAREIRGLLIRRRALFARWEEQFDRSRPTEWWHVIKDEPEELSGLSANTRSKIRRGAKRFEVRPATTDEISVEGHAVYRSAFERYDTFERPLSGRRFRRSIENLPPETEFRAVRERDTGRMVAFSENLVRDDACFYVTIWFEPAALGGYAGYLLIHEMNRHYLNERRLRYVSDGARSLSHQTRIQTFLQQTFGFRRAYARLRVVYFPGVGLAVKWLYPFRDRFERRSGALSRKIAILLEQERIHRACAGEGP